MREFFTSVDVLMNSGLWQPSTAQRTRLRAESIDATLDPGTEMEVRRSSLHLLRTLDPSAAQRVLHRVDDGELVYRAKPAQEPHAQQSRYREFAEHFAAQLTDLGPRWRGKWATAEDRILVDLVTQTLFGRDATQSGHTALLANSGYLNALRSTVTDHLTNLDTYHDVTAGHWPTPHHDYPRTIMNTALEVYRERSFGTQSVTALRAIIAASARAGHTDNLRRVLNEATAPPAARQECAWWLSLPRGVLATTPTP